MRANNHNYGTTISAVNEIIRLKFNIILIN